MKILDPRVDIDTFFGRVSKARNRALLLDYDGTLAPFRKLRHRAFLYPGVQKALNTIIASGHTHLAIISGRSTKELIPLLGLKKLPEIWGSHGHERLFASGVYEVATLNLRAREGLQKAEERLKNQPHSFNLEVKPGSVAVHWRGKPKTQREQIIRITEREWLPLAMRYSLQLQGFDGGVELKAPMRDKGFAVDTIARELGMDTVIAYLGDDQTDEDAFLAVKKYGIGILVRNKYRKTQAQLWIQPPGELLEFLSRWVA